MINDEIRAIAKKISETLPVEQIYLFGSHAYGTPNPESDYDFFLVVDDSMRPMEAMRRAQEAIRSRSRPIDIMANTRGGFERQKQWIASIERVVNQKGVLLYERRGSRSVAE